MLFIAMREISVEFLHFGVVYHPIWHFCAHVK
jgi:hypothetical protein